jgi:hypothetical protein
MTRRVVSNRWTTYLCFHAQSYCSLLLLSIYVAISFMSESEECMRFKRNVERLTGSLFLWRQPTVRGTVCKTHFICSDQACSDDWTRLNSDPQDLAHSGKEEPAQAHSRLEQHCSTGCTRHFRCVMYGFPHYTL